MPQSPELGDVQPTKTISIKLLLSCAPLGVWRGGRARTLHPRTVTTDQAAAFPPALAAVFPAVEHITGSGAAENRTGPQHLTGRLKVFRGCKTARGAQRFCQAHGFVRNLRQGFYRLGVVLRDPNDTLRPRLVRTWDDLTAQLLAS